MCGIIGGAHTTMRPPQFLSIVIFNKFLMQFLCNLLFDILPEIVYYYYINKREVNKMTDYRVYFKDGNQKIFGAKSVQLLFDYLVLNEDYENIIEIERIELDK
jgi:hypothetical protein